MELIAGIESELSARGTALTIQLVAELEVEAELELYRRWASEGRVDGVFVVDLRVDDPRLDELVRIGLPAIVLAGSRGEHSLPTVWQNEGVAVIGAVRYLAALGHRRIARVAGAEDFVQTANRTGAFLQTMEELGLAARVVTTDFMAETGANVTRQLLSDPEPPTAVIYESDILAVAGLGVAHEMGLHVPRDISIIACDDSPFCQVVHPPISAITRDIPGLGAEACRRLLELIERGQCNDLELPYGHLTPRGSTGKPFPSRVPRRRSVSRGNVPWSAARKAPKGSGLIGQAGHRFLGRTSKGAQIAKLPLRGRFQCRVLIGAAT